MKLPNLKVFIRPFIAVLFIYLLLLKGPFKIEQIKFVLAQKEVLLLGLVLIFVQQCFGALRWREFVNQETKITFKSALSLTLVGQFFSFFIPGGVGGDVVKALELAKAHQLPRTTGFATVFVDRIIGLFSMVLFSTFFLGLDYFVNTGSSTILKYFLFSLFLLLGLCFGLAIGPTINKYANQLFAGRNSKVLTIINKLMSSFNLTFASSRNPKLMAKVIFYSFITQLISIFFMLEIIRVLNIPAPSFFVFFSLSCFGFLASAIPITPAGIGVGQAAFYFLFATISSELGDGAVTAISILQLFLLLFALFGGVVFASKPFLSKLKKQ